MTAAPPPPTAFRDAEALAGWLAEHHDTAGELWIRIFKVGAGTPSVTWLDCVVEAIRFGWIDGRRQTYDALSFRQRFTPRKRKSSWSSRNRAHALRLIEEGRMMPAGMAQVEAAMGDGRFEAAYAGSADMVIPQDFLDVLATMPAAMAFYTTLDRTNLYSIYYRLHTAGRPETRAKRMADILARLDRGEKFH